MNNRVLIVVDLSNWIYYTLYGAFSNWKKSSPNAVNIRSAKETDQDNLPDLLVYKDFKKALHDNIHKRLGTINWIAKQNHQDIIDMCDGIDVIFSMDDVLSNNFRKAKYSGYKAQRKLVNKQYDVDKIRDYMLDVALPELELEEKYGYKFVKVEGCESDDVIASIMRRFTDYACRILISSDHDFLQLENVYQYDMAGNRIDRNIDGTELTSKEFLLWKIIRGDVSDNISGVFKGVGEKKSLKLISDKEKLRKMLKENQDSARQYMLNKYLIDFRNIPTELEEKVYQKVSGMLVTEDKHSIIDDLDDISSF